MAVKNGDTVVVDYEGRFENGEVFDTSSHGDHSHPLTFEVGAGQVVAGFDKAVVGMNINEEKEFTILPNEAYGEHDAEGIRDFPRDMFPTEETPEAGMTIMLGSPDGKQFPGQITKVGDDSVTIDLNHPLAGKTLIFKIKVLEIKNNKE